MSDDFDCIEEFDNIDRLPIIGKIRLGVKKASANGGTHPVELPHFVVEPRFHSVLGDAPTRLSIRVVSDDLNKVFPNSLTWYGAAGVKCRGNNRVAERRWHEVEPEIQKQVGGTHTPFEKVRIPCPCHRKGNECTMKAYFRFMIPLAHAGGLFAIQTSSKVSLTNVRGTLKFLRDTLLGRIAMVPLVLERAPQKISYDGKAPKTHWVLRVAFEGTLEAVQRLRHMHGLPPMPDLAALITPPVTAAAAPVIAQPQPPAAAVMGQVPAASGATDTQTVTAPNGAESAAAVSVATASGTNEHSSDAALAGTVSEGPRPAIPHAQVRSRVPAQASAVPAAAATPTAASPSTASTATPGIDTKADPASMSAPKPPEVAASDGPSVHPASGNGTPARRTALTTSAQRSTAAGQAAVPAPRCACGTTVTERVAAYSRGKFGMIRCMACQKRRPAQEVRAHQERHQRAS